MTSNGSNSPPLHPDQALKAELAARKDALSNAKEGMALFLRRVKAKKLHRKLGYSSWTRFVESGTELSRSQADRLLAVVRKYLAADTSLDRFQHLHELGFYKAALLRHVINASNIDAWRARALETDAQTLAREVRDEEQRRPGSTERSKLFQARLQGKQIDNVEDALELAGEIAESDKPGHLIDLICTTFKADHVFSSSPGTKMSELYLAKIEKIMDVRLVVVDPSTHVVKHGMDVIEQLAAGAPASTENE